MFVFLSHPTLQGIFKSFKSSLPKERENVVNDNTSDFLLLTTVLGGGGDDSSFRHQSLAHITRLSGLQMSSFPDVGHIPLKAGWVPSESGARMAVMMGATHCHLLLLLAML